MKPGRIKRKRAIGPLLAISKASWLLKSDKLRITIVDSSDKQDSADESQELKNSLT